VVRVNGQPPSMSWRRGSYITIAQRWVKGDRITLELPMDIRAEPLPDGSDYYAILYGPIVLAAATQPFEHEHLNFYADDSRMGHIPSGPVCPMDQVPTFVSDSPDFADRIERIPGADLRFRFTGTSPLDAFHNLELIPFFRLHFSRYMVYWPYSTPEGLAARQQAAAKAEARRLRLDALTIDQVAPGEQQPEAEHDFEGVDTEAGENFGRHWRHAAGWFGYTLSDPDREARYLTVDYWGADAGRTFSIEVNGVVIAEVTSTGEYGPEFVSVDYPLSREALAASENGRHRVRFIAGADSIAGGVYGVRL
jgi:hypothetical protein